MVMAERDEARINRLVVRIANAMTKRTSGTTASTLNHLPPGIASNVSRTRYQQGLEEDPPCWQLGEGIV